MDYVGPMYTPPLCWLGEDGGQTEKFSLPFPGSDTFACPSLSAHMCHLRSTIGADRFLKQTLPVRGLSAPAAAIAALVDHFCT
jgi:hypothetical protein